MVSKNISILIIVFGASSSFSKKKVFGTSSGFGTILLPQPEEVPKKTKKLPKPEQVPKKKPKKKQTKSFLSSGLGTSKT